MDEGSFCRDCNRETSMVLDHSSGDSICSECGLILDTHFIDETSEWRTFCNDDSNNDKDPIRVGNPTNPFLEYSNLTTLILNPKKNDPRPDFSFLRWQNLHNNHNQDRVLIDGFDTIDMMAERLGIVTVIKDRAKQIFKKMEDQKTSLDRNRVAVCGACLFVSCRENKAPRTLKEICSAAGVSLKDVNRAVELIKKQMDVGVMGGLNAGELTRRFCFNLGLKTQTIKAVQEAVKKSEEIDIRRNPKSLLAGIIYTITQLSSSDQKMNLKDISVATEVAEGTIKKSYKDIYPHASRIVPNWFATEEDLKTLSFPRKETNMCH